jgi:hypothetical protein
VRTWRAHTKMLLDRNEPGDHSHAVELIDQACAEADRLAMKRELVRLDRLRQRTKMFGIDTLTGGRQRA